MLVVATTLTQAPNDKQQVHPMIKVLQEPAAKLGTVTTLIADTGYCSQNNVKACEEAKIEPLLSVAPPVSGRLLVDLSGGIGALDQTARLQLRRRAVAYDPTVAQYVGVVDNVQGALDHLLNQQHRESRAAQRLDGVQHLVNQYRREPQRRFVQHQ